MYQVKWTKIFVNGALVGISYDSELTFDSLDTASQYVSFLNAHQIKAVESLGGGDYTCHVARIVSVNSEVML